MGYNYIYFFLSHFENNDLKSPTFFSLRVIHVLNLKAPAKNHLKMPSTKVVCCNFLLILFD